MKSGILALAAIALSFFGDTPSNEPQRADAVPTDPGKFTFVRIEYDSVGGYGESHYIFDGREWQRWETDYPEAEQNFLVRLEELTTIEANAVPISMRLTNPRIYDFPFIYMCDVGWQTLTNEESTHLRDYLNRGGFLWADDFWGQSEWYNFQTNMEVVFPDLEWRKIPRDHSILNMVFPLEQCPQVPAKIFWESWGESFDDPRSHREPSGGITAVKDVNFVGLFDENDRLMVVATHNSDIGDGWEREAEHIEYFEKFSTKSYAIGINIVAYALTH